MTQIEKIIAEIERLTEVTGYSLSEYENGRRSAMYDIRKQLIEYINTLTAEPSEDLEEAAKENLPNAPYNVMQDNLGGYVGVYGQSKMLDMFMSGAQWQKEKTINKASQWLNENVVEYHPRKGELRPIVNINAFREAMEKEDEQ